MYKQHKIKQLRTKILKLQELKKEYLENYSSKILKKQSQPTPSNPILSESEIPKSESPKKSCRICYENHNLSKNPLLYPCKCKGTIKWVHHECLIKWIQMVLTLTHRRRCQPRFVTIGLKNIRCTVILLKNIIYMTPPPLPRGGSYYELWW